MQRTSGCCTSTPLRPAGTRASVGVLDSLCPPDGTMLEWLQPSRASQGTWEQWVCHVKLCLAQIYFHQCPRDPEHLDSSLLKSPKVEGLFCKHNMEVCNSALLVPLRTVFQSPMSPALPVRCNPHLNHYVQALQSSPAPSHSCLCHPLLGPSDLKPFISCAYGFIPGLEPGSASLGTCRTLSIDLSGSWQRSVVLLSLAEATNQAIRQMHRDGGTG